MLMRSENTKSFFGTDRKTQRSQPTHNLVFCHIMLHFTDTQSSNDLNPGCFFSVVYTQSHFSLLNPEDTHEMP